MPLGAVALSYVVVGCAATAGLPQMLERMQSVPLLLLGLGGLLYITGAAVYATGARTRGRAASASTRSCTGSCSPPRRALHGPERLDRAWRGDVTAAWARPYGRRRRAPCAASSGAGSPAQGAKPGEWRQDARGRIPGHLFRCLGLAKPARTQADTNPRSPSGRTSAPAARTDVELPEDLVQVPLDRSRTQEEARAYLRIG